MLVRQLPKPALIASVPKLKDVGWRTRSHARWQTKHLRLSRSIPSRKSCLKTSTTSLARPTIGMKLNKLAEWCPEYELPPLTQADRRTLLDQLCLGAMSSREIKDRAVWPVVKSWLSAAQLELLDRMAPERFDLPGGRRAKITYAESAPPTLAARIQDLYGVDGDLRIAGGKVSLVIQVLAPNQRPVQVTTSLSNFWKESYPKLKQELQRKYPKHEWR